MWESLFPPWHCFGGVFRIESQLKGTIGCRMPLKNVVSYVVDTATCGAVGSPSCLLYMFLPAHTKETMLCCNYRYLSSTASYSHLNNSVSSNRFLSMCLVILCLSGLLAVSSWFNIVSYLQVFVNFSCFIFFGFCHVQFDFFFLIDMQTHIWLLL